MLSFETPASAPRLMAFDGALLSEILRTVLGFEDGTDRSPGGEGTKQSGTHITEHSTGVDGAQRLGRTCGE